MTGFEPRLLRTDSPHSQPEYTALPDVDDYLLTVRDSGLLGRGGAAFPIAVKLGAVRDAARARGLTPVVVANGEEGEPASVKDRWLLRHRPHLVLDGLRLAAHAVGADRTVVYLSDDEAAASVRAAATGAAVEVVQVAPGYVAGEESAAVRAVDGGPAKPTDKPPRVFRTGVAGRPTLVSNVETLANLPFLARHGASAFRSLGTPASPGTFLCTVNATGHEQGLYELPYGYPLRALLERHGIEPGRVTGALLGGYFAGIVNRRVLDLPLDHETLRAHGTGLGCAAVTVLTADDCAVGVASSLMQYFDRENAGQCGSCFNGIAAMSAVLSALRDGVAGPDDLERLARWSVVLRKRGACGTLDGGANLAASLLHEFPDLVDRHLGGACLHCEGEQ